MLFNSYEFLFVFLPLTILGVYLANRFANKNAVMAVLVCASLFFYAQFKLIYLLIIVFSIVFNYFCSKGLSLLAAAPKTNLNSKAEKPLLSSSSKRFFLVAFGIAVNLLLLGYFKYYDFFITNISALLGAQPQTLRLILPIGISFFTFQQIAFLVDSYKGISKEPKFLSYAFFVSFFPQLIAGPIVHHKEIMPQLEDKKFTVFQSKTFALGLSIFIIGLAKKILIADVLAPYGDMVFEASDAGIAPNFIEAWSGAIAFSLQIYFDFSAYSEMAIGLALMFGLRLPINFRSPYRATSMIEFWRRWHITLSRFLKDYLYIPLGGSKGGAIFKTRNLMIVMILGGLWHGASWTFVIWGFLHGLALSINHLLRQFWPQYVLPKIIILPLLFLYLVVSWVFFKAGSVDSALNILSGMAGYNGIIIPESYEAKLGSIMHILDPLLAREVISFGPTPYFKQNEQIILYLVCLMAVWFLPSALSWLGYDDIAKNKHDNGVVKLISQKCMFGFSWVYGLILGIVATISIIFLYHGKVFLYFQF